MDIYKRLNELGIVLPAPPPRGGLYTPVRIAAGLAFVSGQGPIVDGKPLMTGKLGAGITIEQGQEAARLTAINTLAVLHDTLGDLNRIKGVVKLLALVASAEGFDQQPAVINAASQVFIDVFGEAGWHARSAMGTNELPGGIPVEIESIFELK
jgi:enamine deaminase RidA (YjgF/YER057c/UK114 family)